MGKAPDKCPMCGEKIIKKIGGVLIVTVSTILIGCSNEKIPEGMSKEAYDLANEAIEISQAYVEGDKTAASTFQNLSDLYDTCEKLLTEDSETYTYDLLVSGYIANMEYHVGEDASFEVVGDIEDMNDLLTPIEEVENISDVIVGLWSFNHDNGWVMEIEFKSNGTGSYDLYDDEGELRGSDDFKYTIDEEDKIIKGGSDGTLSWYQVDNITNKSMKYSLIDSPTTGTAYKN